MDFDLPHQDELPDITLAEVWSDFTKKANYIAALPEELQVFANSVQLNNSDDVLVWKGSDSGEFSSSEFRKHHFTSNVERNAWWKKFWQPWIPTKISCFLWKCLNSAVPVDVAVQRAKIPLVSKCVCCVEGHQESLEHLLLDGEAARSLWSFLQGIFGVDGHFPSFNQTAALWIKSSSTESQFGGLKILAFAAAVWEIWKWRNNCIYDHKEDHQTIKQRVIYQLQSLNGFIVPKRNATWPEFLAISCLHIPRSKVQRKKGNWVKWLASSSDLTVNIHALAKDNCFRGSFVVRKNSGDVLWCVSREFVESQGQHLESQVFQVYLLILKEAILTVQSSGFRIAEIQSTDQKLIDCLSGRRVPPWRWISQVSELRSMCGNIIMKRISKEQNMVAVLAANVDRDFFSNPLSSMEIRKMVSEDKVGLARWAA